MSHENVVLTLISTMEGQRHMGHRQLNREKREIIERLVTQQFSIRAIAGILGYSPSAICQEIKRNSRHIEGRSVYTSDAAQRKAELRRRRRTTRIPDLVVNYTAEKLRCYWSPEQIQGRLKVEYPDQPEMRISFKTIYRWIQQSRYYRSPLGTKVLYTKYLRLKRAGKRLRSTVPETRGYRRCLPSIDDRPERVGSKKEFGHWEGDLVNGYRGKGNAVTMVEISTGYLVATYCENKKKEVVAESLIAAFDGLPTQCVKSITLDRGSEFSAYPEVQKRLGCDIYFCHPQSPNERALNEQTNGLLRQFYPKRKTSHFSDPEKLKWAVDLINHRPRKKFGYRTTWEIIKERGLADVFSLV